MKGKGLFIACGVVCVMALAFLIGGDYSAFGGALIVAAVLTRRCALEAQEGTADALAGTCCSTTRNRRRGTCSGCSRARHRCPRS